MDTEPTNTKNILLVVEDDPAVRHLTCGILTAQGYDVVSATNGQVALERVRKHTGPPIHRVVSDVIMPLMGGKVMADWLRAACPDLHILFTSGGTDADISHQGVLDAGIEFLAKPYAPGTLARKVREMLDASEMGHPALPAGSRETLRPDSRRPSFAGDSSRTPAEAA